MFNPFPGLRPFEPDEEHLFFGREQDVDALLRKLRSVRFLSVVGTSGSGKSSLVRSGLIPALTSGSMSGAGSSWRVVVMRPGEDPIGQLAAAVNRQQVPEPVDELAETNRMIVEVTLRRSSLGLAEAVRQTHLARGHHILVLVDQFEELFRFRQSRGTDTRDDAIAFVRLLLEATSQHDLPIYVALTMRSDFIGDCMAFPGLPDAVNTGLYLVGRMGRDALRSAITGPVAVGGGMVAPRLVNRVLNDLGDDQDQLPLVQHALMRTWDHWAEHRTGDAAIDIADYEAVGGFHNALSMHAEEAYRDATALGGALVAERMFKALTDSYSDPRGVRRPTAVDELVAICDTSETQLIRVIEVFRLTGRSFLMPPSATELTSSAIVDLSHESLMRCWTRLIAWATEERAAADFYLRASRGAVRYAAGTAGLWRDPELQLAEQWREETTPTAAWAHRYDERFDEAMAFLDRSLEERARLGARRDRERRATLRRVQGTAVGLFAVLLVFVWLFSEAWSGRNAAAANLALARTAVEDFLASADRSQRLLAADPPEVTEFRRELLEKAGDFYQAFVTQTAPGEALQRDLAFAHLRMGHINRMTERPDDAEDEYRAAIAQFESLAADYDDRVAYRQARADSFNWLGEVLRPVATRTEEAEAAYGAAFDLQAALVRAAPGEPRYQEELARTLYNRGILLWDRNASEAAEGDFREAIRLLEPLAGTRDTAAQGLARVLNNLGGVRDFGFDDVVDARALYEGALDIGERLVAADPDNREHKLELAKYYNNLAALLHEQEQTEIAAARSLRAVELLKDLARLAPALAIERADTSAVLSAILQVQDAVRAERQFREALDLFAELDYDGGVLGQPAFHERFGEFLLNVDGFRASGAAGGVRLLSDAVALYTRVAARVAASGSSADIGDALDTLSTVLPSLPDSERARLQSVVDSLERARDAGGAIP